MAGMPYPPTSVYSVKSVGEYPPPEISVNSVNSVGGLVQTNLEWVLGKEFGGLRGYGRDAIPSYENFHRLHRFSQIRRVWHPCHTHAATKLSSHRIHGTHRNNWRRRKNLCTSVKSVGEYPPPEASVKIRGRLLPARRFCGFCVFRGRFLSEAMLVQRRPLHPLKIATLQQQGCHATTTMLPRYDNKIATLRQQGCHATAKCRETDVRQTGR